MVAPLITDFGDEDHEEGETGLTVAGFDFFPGVAQQGTLWMFENADRSGQSDQLTIGTHTNNSIPGVAIPASPNNATGTVYLAFQRGGDMAWSNSYSFTLSEAAFTAELRHNDEMYQHNDTGLRHLRQTMRHMSTSYTHNE